MRNVFLKIKIKSLAAEAKMIRQEEHKWKPRARHSNDTFHQLREHRVGPVRHEVRHAYLAYAFLSGVAYTRLEQKVRENNRPDADKLHKMVERFGGSRNRGEVDEWLQAA